MKGSNNAPADKQSQLCCVDTYRQPLVGTGSADDTKTLAEAIAQPATSSRP